MVPPRETDESEPKRRRVKSRPSPVRHRFEYVAIRAIVGLLAALPHALSSALCAGLAAFYGWLTRVSNSKSHRAALVNLAIAFPEKSEAERAALLTRMWKNWGRFIADSAHLTKLTPEGIRKIVTFEPEGRFAVMEKSAKSKGLLILTGHFGSFELLHAAVSTRGVPIRFVHRAMNNPFVNQWLLDYRQRLGTVPLGRGEAAREILRELRSGGVVAIPFDQGARRESRVFAPFFGVNASTNSGLARLAMGSGAPVHPAFLVREGTSIRHRAILGDPIDIARTGDKEKDLLENTRRFNRAIEAAVREHPDHWIWMYRRWKQQPEGLCSPYLDESPPVDTYREATARALALE